MPQPHALASCLGLIPWPHSLASCLGLMPSLRWPHASASCLGLMPQPHALTSCLGLMPWLRFLGLMVPSHKMTRSFHDRSTRWGLPKDSPVAAPRSRGPSLILLPHVPRVYASVYVVPCVVVWLCVVVYLACARKGSGSAITVCTITI